METVNNRTERYNHRQQQQQHRQRKAPFSMSDKFSDILTTDYANTNPRKYQRPQTKRNSGGVEQNRYLDSVLKDEHVGRQTKITAASYSPAFAQHTLFSPSFETSKDKDSCTPSYIDLTCLISIKRKGENPQMKRFFGSESILQKVKNALSGNLLFSIVL